MTQSRRHTLGSIICRDVGTQGLVINIRGFTSALESGLLRRQVLGGYQTSFESIVIKPTCSLKLPKQRVSIIFKLPASLKEIKA